MMRFRRFGFGRRSHEEQRSCPRIDEYPLPLFCLLALTVLVLFPRSTGGSLFLLANG